MLESCSTYLAPLCFANSNPNSCFFCATNAAHPSRSTKASAAPARIPRVLRFHVEVRAMCAEKEVARQGFENTKRALVILGDRRIPSVANQLVARIDVRTSDDHRVVRLATIADCERPGRAALRVAWSEVRDQHDVAELYLVPIVQYAIDAHRRVSHGRVVAVLEVGAAARFDHGDVSVHDHVARARELLQHGAAGVMIPVRVADQQDLHVAELEAQLGRCSPE